MGCMRPATPGFIVTLVATLLLTIVTLGVPYSKSVFFLRGSISQDGVNGTITVGTLGYCLELSNGTACSQATVLGYNIDINSLVGSNLQFPQVAPRWITSALLIHVIALIVAAVSALFGLLAHVREMSMACCSTCFSGLAAFVAFVAFIFDIIIFLVAKSRISSVGSAQIGPATWLTFAAALVLFFSGCFYVWGRRCINDRPPKRRGKDKKQSEVGLPEFSEIQPLKVSEPPKTVRQLSQTADIGIDGEVVHMNEPQTYHQQSSSGGYAPGAPGSRAMDDYNQIENTQNTYPPRPQRRPSEPSVYPPVTHSDDMLRLPANPTAYGPYGHATPSPIPPDGPSYFSATDPRQGLNYRQYNPSPSPLQDPYNPYSSPNQFPSYSYAIPPLSSQAGHQRGQDNYIPGRVDPGPNYPQYNPPMTSAFTVPNISNQSAQPRSNFYGIPSPSPQESHQPRQGPNYNHISNPYGENISSPSPSDNEEVLSLLNPPMGLYPPPSPPQPSSSLQESHQTRETYPSPPPPPPPPPSSSPQESHQNRKGNYIHEGVDHDLPPPDYTF